MAIKAIVFDLDDDNEYNQSRQLIVYGFRINNKMGMSLIEDREKVIVWWENNEEIAEYIQTTFPGLPSRIIELEESIYQEIKLKQERFSFDPERAKELEEQARAHGEWIKQFIPKPGEGS